MGKEGGREDLDPLEFEILHFPMQMFSKRGWFLISFGRVK